MDVPLLKDPSPWLGSTGTLTALLGTGLLVADVVIKESDFSSEDLVVNSLHSDIADLSTSRHADTALGPIR